MDGSGPLPGVQRPRGGDLLDEARLPSGTALELPLAAVLERAVRRAVPDPVPVGTDRAAVAVVLRQGRAEAEVLLIRRAVRAGDPWSGQMGLPGGRWEPGDPTLADTARRETSEEVGLALAGAQPIAQLATIPAVGRGLVGPLTITPYVFLCPESAGLALNDEVAEAVWVGCGALVAEDARVTVVFERDGHRHELPAWQIGDHVVWGLTYSMLKTLLEPDA